MILFYGKINPVNLVMYPTLDISLHKYYLIPNIYLQMYFQLLCIYQRILLATEMD